MPIRIDKRIKKRSGIARYRVVHNYTDSKGQHQKIERLVWGKAEAQATLRELEAEYSDKHSAASRMTVKELIDLYDEYHAIDTKRTSHEAVIRRLRYRVLPHFGNKRIDKLTQHDFARWKVEINKENLALSSKQNIYCAFVALLNYAVKMEYIPKNNLSVLGNFKDSTVIEKPSEKIHYYTAAQFEKYIKQARSDCKSLMDWGFYVFFCIAFFTGARKGEINSLRWSDINGNILRIRRGVSQKLKGDDIESTPKTKSSVRDLQLPEPLIVVLDEHKERCKAVAKDLFSEDDYICGCDKPLRDTTIDTRNRRYAEMAGLPRIRVHDFRHSNVSLLANEGINIQEVARRLGHSNVQETWNTYCHLYPREEERAIMVLNKVGNGIDTNE